MKGKKHEDETLKTPDTIKQWSPKYKDNSWKDYSPFELGMWVHLLLKRSTHRSNEEGRAKDIQDASNYLDMLLAHLQVEEECCS